MKKTVLGAGLIAVDHIFLANERGRSPKTFEYLGSAGGGSIPNTLCFLSILGYSASMFGVTGNDICERIIKDDFRQFGVDYSFVKKRGNKENIKITRQFSHLILRNGKHRFLKKCLECGSIFNRDYQISKKDASKNIINSAHDIDLFISDRSNEASITIAKIVHQNNNKIAYDWGFLSYGKYLDKTEQLLNISHLVKTDDKIFKKYMKGNDNDAIMRWWEKFPNVKYLFVTNGEKGVYGYATINNIKNIFHYDSIYCENLKDSSGAGDVFFGSILSELLLTKPPNDIKGFEVIVNTSQALASLSCTLYGARALQRSFLNQKLTKNEIKELATEIYKNNKSSNSFSPSMGLPLPLTEPYRLKRIKGCDICGQLYTNRKKINKKRRSKISDINKNLTRLPWTMKTSFEIGKSYRKKIINIKEKNAILIGSGGSYSASIFGETLYLHSLGNIARAITPYEFEGLNAIQDNIILWLISHGGNNTDILGAALHAINIKTPEVVVLTANKNSKIADISRNNNWNNIFIQSEERNFVSIIGYMSQISALSGLLASENELIEMDNFFTDRNILSVFNTSRRSMKRLAQQIAINGDSIQDIHIVGLARGWGWPALMDFESKIVEGGICTMEISELKNFTHGRYINTYGKENRRVIMFQTPNEQDIIEFLCKKFKNRVEHVVISTDEYGIVGSFELLISSILLAYYLSRLSKKDILSPKYPREARGLYSWEPEYRKGIWKKNSSKKTKPKIIKPTQLQ